MWGKAIGVLMLIVQISGANAAYPVQMLPDFIAKVSPFLPLTHAVTMMRAAIAGIYDMDYWRAAGMLLAFVPPLLLLGLLLRKPLVRFNQWYVAQVESTKSAELVGIIRELPTNGMDLPPSVWLCQPALASGSVREHISKRRDDGDDRHDGDTAR